MADPERIAEACTNCGTTLVGTFCHACGQKRFVESDRRFGHLLGQFVGSLTDLDGRIWRTIRALLFQPGLLAREYFEGRRAQWLSPVSLFLAISVVYFVAPIRGGDLTLLFDQQVSGEIRHRAAGADHALTQRDLESTGQAHTPFTTGWIERRVRDRDAAARAPSRTARPATATATTAPPTMPARTTSARRWSCCTCRFAALALAAFFVRQRRYFAEHFVFTLHYFAYWMIALQFISQLSNLVHLLPWQPADAVYDWFMRLLLPGYAVLALRRAYSIGWLAALGAAVAGSR
jgi:hypothetical protein